MKKIVLVGYMGAGKSVIGQLVANILQWSFIDLDDLIEKRAGLTIKAIFETKGELYFRKIENQIFVELIHNNHQLIIATAGGTPCYYNNHEVLKLENVTSIYLKASINLLFERLKHDNKNRPLLLNKTDDELKEFIAKHLFERSYFYNQAKFIINIDGKNGNEVAKELLVLSKIW